MTGVQLAAAERPSSRVVNWAVVIALVALTVTFVLVRDDRPRAKAGQAFAAADQLPDAVHRVVLVPTGRLDVAATGPVDDVDGDAGVRTHRAPSGGSFVGVQIVQARPPSDADAVIDPRVLGPVTGARSGDAEQPLGVTLVADGRRYPVREANDSRYRLNVSSGKPIPTSQYVALATRPASVRLEVTFGGRRQSIDLQTGRRSAGVFAPLYANRPQPRTCGPVTVGLGARPGRIAAGCRIEWTAATPWYPKAGWAPAGRAWRAVLVTTTAPSGFTVPTPTGPARFDSELNQDDRTVRLDAAAPETTDIRLAVGQFSAVSVFSVPVRAAASPRTLSVVVKWDSYLRHDDPLSAQPDHPYGYSVATSWSVRV